MNISITPFLWFRDRVEEAVELYTSVFPDATVTKISRRGGAADGSKGDVISAEIELQGQRLILFHGGPTFEPTPAFSLLVQCRTQAEVDQYWSALTTGGGSEQPCGWLTDKFGVSWQIVPEILPRYLQDEDPAKAGRVAQAMMKMKKIVIADLERAWAGE